MSTVAAGIAAALGTGSWMLGSLVAVLLTLGRRVRASDTTWSVFFGIGAIGLGMSALWGVPVESLLPLFLAGLMLHFVAWDPHPGVKTLIGALLLVVAGVQSQSPWFLIAWLLWLGSLVDRPGRGPLLLPLALISTVLFLLLPRFGHFQSDDQGDALTGFDQDVELGDLQDLLDDPTRVFTATFSKPPTGPIYFRGVALDRFDGRRWWSEAARTREPDYSGALADTVRITVELEAHPESVLFVAGAVDGLDSDGLAVDRDDAGAYHLPGPPRAVRYTAFVQPPYGPGRGDPFLDAEPRTDLPAQLSAASRSLFLAQASDATTPQQRMQALTTWLRATYTYTRAPRDADPEAPLEHFLLSSREGHCEYFASALAVGGRVLGVPTRVVNGFVGGETIGGDTIVLRRYHAHSWVEYFDGDQWILADATPHQLAPSSPGVTYQTYERATDLWEDLLDFDGEQQVQSAAALSTRVAPFAPIRARPLLGAMLIGMACGLGLLWARRLSRPKVRTAARAEQDPITTQLRTLLQDFQGDPGRGISDLQRVADVVRVLPEVEGPLEQLLWLSYRVRFDGLDPNPHRSEVRELVNQVAMFSSRRGPDDAPE